MPDGRALDCKPKVDVCLRVGSIPASGIMGAWCNGNTLDSSPSYQGSNPCAPVTFDYLEAWRNGNALVR